MLHLLVSKRLFDCVTYRIGGRGKVRTSGRGRIGCCSYSNKSEGNEKEVKGEEMKQNKINRVYSTHKEGATIHTGKKVKVSTTGRGGPRGSGFP